ncbi:MAG: ParB/RepB/Spo0J family partition protein [Vibrio splendidus]
MKEVANNQTLTIEYCNPSDLKPNPWNPNKVDVLNEDKLDESIRQLGFVKPIIVRELSDGSLEILGGEHRSQSAIRQGLASVPYTNLGCISDEDAKKIGLIDNGRYGEDDLSLLTAVFQDLGSPEDIMSILPISDEEARNIFSHDMANELDELDLLADLEDDSDDEMLDLDAGSKSTPTHQIMRFKVAIEDASKVEEFINSIKTEQSFTEQDQLTNAGDALIHAITTHPNFKE